MIEIYNLRRLLLSMIHYNPTFQNTIWRKKGWLHYLMIQFVILRHIFLTSFSFNADNVCMELFVAPKSYQKHMK